MLRPRRLTKGDTVGIIAPASPPELSNLQKSIDFLHDLGLQVKLGKNVGKRYGYLAGCDEERLEDLHAMFSDQEIKAIFCARGGYGTARIAKSIDYKIIKENPKIFWGYSDITFLHNAIQQKTGLVTFHGPMLFSDLGKENVHPMTRHFFRQLFQPVTISYTENISPLKTVVKGETEGVLVGGNLSLIISTLGTPFEIETEGKILLIEEVNEKVRSIDRMLNQLFMAGKLSAAKGILIGDFHNCSQENGNSLPLDEVIEYYIKKANKPCLMGLKVGHCSPNLAIPLGVYAQIKTESKQVLIDHGVS